MRSESSRWDPKAWESGEFPAFHAGGAIELVELDQDHPGFRDSEYRGRRNDIAAVALAYSSGDSVPDVEYVEDEQDVWRRVWTELDPLHKDLVCAELLAAGERLGMNRETIPQLSELNLRLAAATGFCMEPVAGLVSARVFLSYLGRSVFLSTQYIRHASRPLYTPEPDVVHELVGHAASLGDSDIAGLSRAFGGAAILATQAEIERIERVYWYTLEFGVALEQGEPKAYGAGLLSSVGELARIRGEAELDRAWDLEEIARTPYDPTEYQPRLFVAPSFARALEDVGAWLESGAWRVSLEPRQ